MTEIQTYLFSRQDLVYRDFQARLMPTVSKENIIGVRVPLLREYAKQIQNTPLADAFLSTLPHTYYEENNLHAFLLMRCKNYDKIIAMLDAFLPYVDNWATCDSMRPNALMKQPERFMADIKRYLSSTHPYTTRFGIEMLMNFFLDKSFTPQILPLVYEINSENYYVNMMQAWFFADALIKQWDETVKCVQQGKLNKDVLKLTVKKCRESYRLTPEQKEYLKSFI